MKSPNLQRIIAERDVLEMIMRPDNQVLIESNFIIQT